MYRSLCPICRVNRLMTLHEVGDVCPLMSDFGYASSNL